MFGSNTTQPPVNDSHAGLPSNQDLSAGFDWAYDIATVFEYTVCVLGIPTIPLLTAISVTKSNRKQSFSLYMTIMSLYDMSYIWYVFLTYFLWHCCYTIISDINVSDATCQSLALVGKLSLPMSLWFNVAMAADRFIVIVFPFHKERLCTRKVSWVVSLCILLTYHALGALPLVHSKVGQLNVYMFNRSYCSYTFSMLQYDFIALSMFGTIVPTFLTFVFTVVSAVQLVKLSVRRQGMTSIKEERMSRASVALVVIGMSTVVTQIPGTIPKAIRLYWQTFDPKTWHFYRHGTLEPFRIFNIIMILLYPLRTFVCIQNFFIMFAINPRFRKDLAKLLRCGANTKSKPTSQKSST